ncbi:hypothetical protein [Streptomyces sp. NPDC059003]|uniref:hypothetical protein n=1 Tax=Streptomyces sp. NPDC059003 TaxID=3346691 RepID=UPI003679762F
METLPQYMVSAERHDNALADDFTTIARRLPALSMTALRLAWDADRRAVLLAAVLQLATGAITAIGLYATRGTLAPLFAPGPIAERIQHDAPSLAAYDDSPGATTARPPTGPPRTLT